MGRHARRIFERREHSEYAPFGCAPEKLGAGHLHRRHQHARRVSKLPVERREQPHDHQIQPRGEPIARRDGARWSDLRLCGRATCGEGELVDFAEPLGFEPAGFAQPDRWHLSRQQRDLHLQRARERVGGGHQHDDSHRHQRVGPHRIPQRRLRLRLRGIR